MSDETQDTEVVPASEMPLALRRADVPALFQPFEEAFTKLSALAQAILDTPPGDKAVAKMAREMRLQFRESRIALDKKRKEINDEKDKEVRSVNARAKDIRDKFEAAEEKLSQIEQYAELEKARLELDLRRSREDEIRQYFAGSLAADLGKMPEEEWKTLLQNQKDIAELAEKKKAEEERARIAAEEKRAAEEAARIAEIERLREEKRVADEAAAKARREREEYEFRVNQLHDERQRQILPYMSFAPSANWGLITEEKFQETLAQAKDAHTKAQAERQRLRAEKEEADRKAAEERKAAEVARQEQESKAAAERAKAEADRKAQEEALAAERARVKKLEDERRAAEEARLKADREAQQRAAREEEERLERARAAEAASDQDKLVAYLTALRAVPVPSLVSSAGVKKLAVIRAGFISTK